MRFLKILFHKHHNCWYSKGTLGPPLFPVECNICGELFYMERKPKGCTCAE